MPAPLQSVLLVFVAAVLPAATILVSPGPGTSAPSIIDSITGADMAGLIVTETYFYPPTPVSSNVTVSAVWAATGPVSGGANPSGPLTLTGPTNGQFAWSYTYTRLSTLLSLELDGTNAGIYFDRTDPNPGTPGSGPGIDLTLGSRRNGTPLILNYAGDMVYVIYSSPVSVGGNPPQGDLYSKVTIDFSHIGVPDQPGFVPQDFRFTLDTDRSGAPEPATGLLLLCGLALIYAKMPRRCVSALGKFGRPKPMA